MLSRRSSGRCAGLALATLLLLPLGLTAGAAPLRGEAGSGLLAILFEEGMTLLRGLLAGLDPSPAAGQPDLFAKEGPHMDPWGNPTSPAPPEPGGGAPPG